MKNAYAWIHAVITVLLSIAAAYSSVSGHDVSKLTEVLTGLAGFTAGHGLKTLWQQLTGKK